MNNIHLLEYDPAAMVATWKVDIDIECQNLTEEQKELVGKIIDAHRGNNTGMSEFTAMLNDLAKAGFRGEIQSFTDPSLNMRVLINCKIESENESD